jgi:hypothetical protein
MSAHLTLCLRNPSNNPICLTMQSITTSISPGAEPTSSTRQPVMPQSVLAHSLASMSHTKLIREVLRAEPDLRRYAAFANTLDAMTEWIYDDMQRKIRDGIQQMVPDGLHTAPLSRQEQQEMGWDVAGGELGEILNNTNQEAQCETIERMPNEAKDEMSAEDLQELESRIRDEFEIRETLAELAMINPQFQKGFKVHVTERTLETGEAAEKDDEWQKVYEDKDTEEEDDDGEENDADEDGRESSDDDNDSDSSSDGGTDYLRMITLSARMDEAKASTSTLNNNSSNRTSHPCKRQPYSRQLSTIFKSQVLVMSTHLPSSKLL